LKPLFPFLKSPRLWGLAGTALLLYFLVFVAFGRLDVSWIMPPTDRIAKAIIDVWPRMPFFAVQKESIDSGGNEVVYYTVPTRQLTPQEIARIGSTNVAVRPVAPK